MGGETKAQETVPEYLVEPEVGVRMVHLLAKS